MSEPETSQPAQRNRRGGTGGLVSWILLTLATGALLAGLLGSATPRIRLLGIFPFAEGAVIAAAALFLKTRFRLTSPRASVVWILLLAMGVAAGTTCCSWQLWKRHLTREHAETQARIDRFLQDADEEARTRIRRENLDIFRERVTFSAYLGHRLEAFARRLGRPQGWDSPVPELVFGFELLLALIGAAVVLHQDPIQAAPPRRKSLEE
jgi:hypothetical protein